MLSRRDAIKGVIAIGGGLAASNIVGQDFEPSLKPAPLHAKKHWPEVNKLGDTLHKELIECKRYVRRWKRWRKSEGEPDQITPSGVAVPFATQPLNFYLRPADEAEQQLKPPKIPYLMYALEGWGAYHQLQAMLEKLWLEDPPFGDGVDKLTLRMPGNKWVHKGRTATPRIALDIEELEERAVARMVIGFHEGLRAELDMRLEHAKQAFLETYKSRRWRVRQQWKQPQMAVKKNGYMFEAFSYVVTAGYIEPASREGVTCSL